jgi:hypothetical protein
MTVGRSFVLRNTHFSKINSGEDLAVFMNVCPERSYQRGDVLFRLSKVLLDQACRYKIHMPALTAMVDPLGG